MVSGLSSSDHDRVQLDNHSDVSEENRKRTVKCHRDAPSLLADTYIHTCCCTSCEHDPSQLNEARASLNYWVDQEG